MQQAIRNWIVAQLETVPNIGTVHSYQRYADREKALADLYLNNGKLHGWYVRRVAVVEKSLSNITNIEHSTWHIVGYLAINDVDASELVFDELIEAVRDLFRVVMANAFRDVENEQIGLFFNEQIGTEQIGLKILESQPVMFAGVLCHSVKCQLITHRLVHV
jgi:hypothetical protein